MAALESEHGYQDARCDVCGRDRDAVDLPWADPSTGDQFLACSDDQKACHTLAAANHPTKHPAPAHAERPAARPLLRVISGGRRQA